MTQCVFTSTDRNLAESLFTTIAAETRQLGGDGVCRPSYGSGETTAWRIIATAATDFGLHAEAALAGNLLITKDPLTLRQRSTWVGSHLDSVPRGGNYDGLAGVVAAILLVAKAREHPAVPSRPPTRGFFATTPEEPTAMTHDEYRKALAAHERYVEPLKHERAEALRLCDDLLDALNEVLDGWHAATDDPIDAGRIAELRGRLVEPRPGLSTRAASEAVTASKIARLRQQLAALGGTVACQQGRIEILLCALSEAFGVIDCGPGSLSEPLSHDHDRYREIAALLEGS